MREQATQALTAIYNNRPKMIRALTQTDAPWQEGVRFATAKGSEGTAAYTVAGTEGETWTYGSIYGYKSQGSPQMSEVLFQSFGAAQPRRNEEKRWHEGLRPSHSLTLTWL